MSEWQPIETVPKDGTQFLGWGRYNQSVATYAFFNDNFWAIHDGSTVIEYQNDSGADYRSAPPLDVWQPLPEPPKITLPRADRVNE